MTTTVDFGPVSRDPAGKLGARAFVDTNENGWTGVYEFDTHGLSPQGVEATLAAIAVYHQKKAARLSTFGAVRGVESVISKRLFRIIDCTLWEEGGDALLFVDVKEIIGQEARGVAGFPLRQRFANVDDVPDNTTIVGLAFAVASDRVVVEQAHADFVTRAAALIPTVSVGLPKPGGGLP